VTHGDFWIPDEEREVYRLALKALNDAAIPFVVAGAYAIYEHTGIYRQTKDLDLFVEPSFVIPAAGALHDAGFILRLEELHWLAKGFVGDKFVDLIYGMGNGLAFVDDDWFLHSCPGVLAAHEVRIAPAEELIWHRLFINERHRHDMSDILHLILCEGESLDWERLLRRVGEHWPLLLAQLQMFKYVYPGYRGNVPAWVTKRLIERAQSDVSPGEEEADLTRGTLISRFSFAIDVREWGFVDPRSETVRQARNHPGIREIGAATVWDQRGDERDTPREGS
jgi:hypothetical protein